MYSTSPPEYMVLERCNVALTERAGSNAIRRSLLSIGAERVSAPNAPRGVEIKTYHFIRHPLVRFKSGIAIHPKGVEYATDLFLDHPTTAPPFLMLWSTYHQDELFPEGPSSTSLSASRIIPIRFDYINIVWGSLFNSPLHRINATRGEKKVYTLKYKADEVEAFLIPEMRIFDHLPPYQQ